MAKTRESTLMRLVKRAASFVTPALALQSQGVAAIKRPQETTYDGPAGQVNMCLQATLYGAVSCAEERQETDFVRVTGQIRETVVGAPQVTPYQEVYPENPPAGFPKPSTPEYIRAMQQAGAVQVCYDVMIEDLTGHAPRRNHPVCSGYNVALFAPQHVTAVVPAHAQSEPAFVAATAVNASDAAATTPRRSRTSPSR